MNRIKNHRIAPTALMLLIALIVLSSASTAHAQMGHPLKQERLS